jgi:hypothetical protein
MRGRLVQSNIETVPATAVNKSKHGTRSIRFFIVLVPLFLPQNNWSFDSGKNNGVLTKTLGEIGLGVIT